MHYFLSLEKDVPLPYLYSVAQVICCILSTRRKVICRTKLVADNEIKKQNTLFTTANRKTKDDKYEFK